MAGAGIDTVILIRAGYRERLAYPSAAVSKHIRTLPAHEDLISLFLRLCEPRNMRFFFGTYDSGRFWHRHEWRREVEVNRGLVREAWARYGGHVAFGENALQALPRIRSNQENAGWSRDRDENGNGPMIEHLFSRWNAWTSSI
jgi:hypothetical protein